MRARDICLIAVLSATLTVGKMALSFLANVEVVTLLLTVYALTLPRSKVFIATFTFIATEAFIWGAHIWILMYLIHWPTLVFCASLFKGKFAPIFAIITAVVLTGLFGVQTTVLEVLFLMNYHKIGFMKCFLLRYGTGVPFFITHVISNSIILSVLVYPLYRLMQSLARQYFKVPVYNAITKDFSAKTRAEGSALHPKCTDSSDPASLDDQGEAGEIREAQTPSAASPEVPSASEESRNDRP